MFRAVPVTTIIIDLKVFFYLPVILKSIPFFLTKSSQFYSMVCVHLLTFGPILRTAPIIIPLTVPGNLYALKLSTLSVDYLYKLSGFFLKKKIMLS
jgi:hypothetical protein